MLYSAHISCCSTCMGAFKPLYSISLLGCSSKRRQLLLVICLPVTLCALLYTCRCSCALRLHVVCSVQGFGAGTGTDVTLCTQFVERRISMLLVTSLALLSCVLSRVCSCRMLQQG
jgi:hypothetical protein